MKALSLDRAREVLAYNPATGVLSWRVAMGQRGKVGSEAGTVCPSGYRYIQIDGRRYRANRLAWLIYHGVWPSGLVDHEDRDRDNNRIANLRDATRSQNGHNRGANRNSTTGLKGVSPTKRGRFEAQITTAGVRLHLGTFDDAEAAHAAYVAASKQQHGSFARASS